MKAKNIENIFPPPPIHFVGDGFRVHNFIPRYKDLSMERMNPFIMLDYNSPFYFPPRDYPRGVGVHPHRGFETVTIAFKGRIAHHDSSGGGGIIGEGDVQWMTASSGILHKEYHEENYSKKGGIFHMAQLWVNLPSKFKMSEPKYQSLTNDKIPKIYSNDRNVEIQVIAGELNGIAGAASTFSEIHLYTIHIKENGSYDLNFPEEFNTAALIIEGEVSIQNTIVPNDHFVLFEKSGELISFLGNADNSTILLMSAKPLMEPIAASGPFVMNTEDEIYQAYTDFKMGKFGYLED
jgi:quercetin 2,3-dioxygenase